MATLNDEYTTPASGAASLAGRGGSTQPGLPAVSQAAPGEKIVEAGDIMEQLKNWSNEFGTDPGSILRENNITDTGDIRPGQMLTIPTEKTISSRTRGLIAAPEGGDETENLMTRLISGFDVGADEQFEDFVGAVHFQ